MSATARSRREAEGEETAHAGGEVECGGTDGGDVLTALGRNAGGADGAGGAGGAGGGGGGGGGWLPRCRARTRSYAMFLSAALGSSGALMVDGCS